MAHFRARFNPSRLEPRPPESKSVWPAVNRPAKLWLQPESHEQHLSIRCPICRFPDSILSFLRETMTKSYRRRHSPDRGRRRKPRSSPCRSQKRGRRWDHKSPRQAAQGTTVRTVQQFYLGSREGAVRCPYSKDIIGSGAGAVRSK